MKLGLRASFGYLGSDCWASSPAEVRRGGRGRGLLGGLSGLVVTALVLLPGVIHAQSLQSQLELLKHPPAAVPVNAVSSPDVVTPALAKFQASGRISATLSAGTCASGPVTSCTNCDQIQVTGPVTLSPGGKGTLSACMTVDFTNVTNPLCIGDEQGNGTITMANGDTLKFATGGNFCIADEIPPVSPTSVLFMSSGGYTFEGGTGKQASAVGQGNFSFPWIEATSFTSNGEFSMVGNYAKQ
jgi:hypothetical protein